MKLSVEAKVAAAVAAAFMALTPGAMAQGHSKGQTGGPNHYGPTNNPGANTHMSQQGDKSSMSGRINAEENRQNFSDEQVTSSGREQREERHAAYVQREQRHNAVAREERHNNREQRFDRLQAHRQREQRFQSKSTKDKSPFDGSILEVKPADLKR